MYHCLRLVLVAGRHCRPPSDSQGEGSYSHCQDLAWVAEHRHNSLDDVKLDVAVGQYHKTRHSPPSTCEGGTSYVE